MSRARGTVRALALLVAFAGDAAASPGRLRSDYPSGAVVEVTPRDRAAVDAARSRILVRRDRRQALHTVTIRPQ